MSDNDNISADMQDPVESLPEHLDKGSTEGLPLDSGEGSSNLGEQAIAAENSSEEDEVQIYNPDAGTAPRRGRRPRATAIERASRQNSNRAAVLDDANRRAHEREQRNVVRQQFLAGWAGLQSAMRRETIMYGTVASIEEKPLGETSSAYLKTGIFLTIIHNKTYKILIPFQALYRRFPVDMHTVDLNSEEGVRSFILRQRAMAEKLYGVTIPFVIDYMDANRVDPEADYAIGASRAKALEIFEKANYEPGPDGNVAVTEGSFVTDARIISVSDWSIQCNVKGVDTIIPVRNLTYRYISKTTDISDLFKVGDTISVQVLQISKGSDGIHDIEVSAKPVELIKAKASSLAIREGEMTYGTVTTIADSRNNPGQVVISLYLDMYDRPAYSNEFPASKLGFYPQPGDKVRVTVRQIFDSGMIRVSCRQTHGPMDLFNR